MSVGWAGTNVNAIATTLSYWFERRRGFALKLALNGSSTGGFLVTPLLTHVVHRVGLGDGVMLLVLAGLAILLPVIVLGVGRPPENDTHSSSGRPHAMSSHLPAFDNEAQALRSIRFWSIALPFSLVLSAQVGFIVNQMAFLLSHLGADGASFAIAAMAVAAFAGRSTLAPVIDRLNQRRASAATFACQAFGLVLMLTMPDSTAALYIGSVMVGLSIGNVVSLPPLLIQHEFAPQSFGLLVGLSASVGTLVMAVGPTLFGLARDLSGGYSASLALCIGFDLIGVAIVMRAPRQD